MSAFPRALVIGGLVAMVSLLILSSLGLTVGAGASVGPASKSRLGWHQQTLSASPPSGRARVAFAYDAFDHYMVLYGGYSAPSLYYDTWGYVAGLWSQLNPSTHPSAPVGLTMVYDPALKGVLAFGGENPFPSAVQYNDTWLYKGGSWTQLSPHTSPSARGYYEMTYDPAISAILLFGGESGGASLSDTWEFNGTNWIQLHPSSSPPGIQTGAMVYDSASSQVLVMGGYNSTISRAPTGTWGFSAGTWKLIPGSHMPSRTWFQAATLKNGTPVFFGGQVGSSTGTCGVGSTSVCNDTYEFYSGAWHPVRAAHAPSDRRNGGFAYDARDGYDVYFGGVNASLTWFSETWVLK